MLLLHLQSHCLHADKHNLSNPKRMNESETRFINPLEDDIFDAYQHDDFFYYLATDFRWKACLCHNVLSNIFELLCLFQTYLTIGKSRSLIFGKPLMICTCPNKQLSFSTVVSRREAKQSFMKQVTFLVPRNMQTLQLSQVITKILYF